MTKQETPDLLVQFDKRRDGKVVLRCTRRDGSITWQRHDKHGVFFAFHDLRHFAVETTLGFRGGFFGLIADGWDIEDTTGKGERGKPSAVAGLVEHIVGLFDAERAGGAPPLRAAEFNDLLDQMLGPDPAREPITDDQLKRVRERVEELHAQWAATPAGSTLDLTITRS